MHERVPDRTPEAQSALQNIVRSGRRLVLGGLAREDVGRLIELTRGSAAAAALGDSVYAATEGNPFFAGEVLAPPACGGAPRRAAGPAAVARRRARHDPAADRATRRRPARAARAGGDHRAARSASRRSSAHHRSPHDCVADALEEAGALGLVAPVPGTLGRYRFVHGLIRDTLLAGMPAERRMLGHRAVGEALEDIRHGTSTGRLPELAHHFLVGGLLRRQMQGDRLCAASRPGRARRARLRAGGRPVRERPGRARRPGAGRPAPRRAAARARNRPVARRPAGGARDVRGRGRRSAGDRSRRRPRPRRPRLRAVRPHPGLMSTSRTSRCSSRRSSVSGPATPRSACGCSARSPSRCTGPTMPRAAAQLARDALEMARRLGDDATLAIALSSAQLATCGPDADRAGTRVAR